MIQSFDEIKTDQLKLAGEKGSSLVQMYRNNFPVPNGFIILSSTFDEILKEKDLYTKIKTLEEDVDFNNEGSIISISDQIQEIILNLDIPNSILLNIYKHFEKLNSEFVAVRSSVIADEDKQWEGQLATFLNSDKENLINYIKKCWSSIFTSRALVHRNKNSLSVNSIAVIIQKMIQSDVSGVAFSTSPVSKNKREMIIEAALGLGESVVLGKTTPDNYIIDKNNFTILHKSINFQKTLLYKNEDANVWVNLNVEEGNYQKLSDKQIVSIAKKINEIEDFFGFFVDVEWSLYKNKFYILQSRKLKYN